MAVACGRAPGINNQQQASCGVAIVDAGSSMNLGSVPENTAQAFTIPIQDTADTDETLLGVSVTGTNAADFTVQSTFPISVPAGTSQSLSVQFVPTNLGFETATLQLETESMGTSSITLQGYGE